MVNSVSEEIQIRCAYFSCMDFCVDDFVPLLAYRRKYSSEILFLNEWVIYPIATYPIGIYSQYCVPLTKTVFGTKIVWYH